MRYLVRALVKYRASDLHIKVGRPPLFRVNGNLVAAKIPELTLVQVEEIIYSVLADRQKEELSRKKQIDLSFDMVELGRYRANIYYQRNTLSAAIRMIPSEVRSLSELGIPPVVKELCSKPHGLILITGATGSGKSTTLSAMIQHINESSPLHILTLEDPIEFLHRDLKATITQREAGTDCLTISDGFYAGLRQDPDVIMIGELRDYKMIQLALSAAESGHLVISSLHTSDARSTIDRILDVFPPESQNQARIQLSSTLLGVVAQQLLVRSSGEGRVAICEVMVNSPTIASQILKQEIDKIPETIANSTSYYQMQTMNQALERLVRAGEISVDEALRATTSADDLKLSLSGMLRGEGYQSVGEFELEPVENSSSAEEPKTSLIGLEDVVAAQKQSRKG
jgi:twitching motility protein PilT